MRSNNKATTRSQQFLGEMAADLIALSEAALAPQGGRPVWLRVSRRDIQRRPTIRVEDEERQCLGLLSPDVADWLAPLLRSGKIVAEGFLPASSPDQKPNNRLSRILTLMIWLTHAGRDILHPSRKIRSLHPRVVRVYRKAQQFSDPQSLVAYQRSLASLSRRALRPESRLLLALIAAIERELKAAVALDSQVRLAARLGSLTVGEPIEEGGLTLYPLFSVTPTETPYRLLDDALADHSAVVAEMGDSQPSSRVFLNNSDSHNVLVPAGHILRVGREARLVSSTVLAPARAITVLPAVALADEPAHASDARHLDWAPPSLRWPCLTGRQGKDLPIDPRPAAPLPEPTLRRGGEEGSNSRPAPGQGPAVNLVSGRVPGNCVGIAATFADKVLIELFASPAMFASAWKRLWQAYRCDLPSVHRLPSLANDPDQVRHLLRSAASHAHAKASAHGLGAELAILGPGLQGTALVHGDCLCHLAAVAAPQPAQPPSGLVALPLQ